MHFFSESPVQQVLVGTVRTTGYSAHGKLDSIDLSDVCRFGTLKIFDPLGSSLGTRNSH